MSMARVRALLRATAKGRTPRPEASPMLAVLLERPRLSWALRSYSRWLAARH